MIAKCLKSRVCVLVIIASLFNYTIEKDQLVNGFVLWQGTHEKHHILIQMFIEALSKPKEIVIDVVASTVGYTILSSTIMFR